MFEFRTLNLKVISVQREGQVTAIKLLRANLIRFDHCKTGESDCCPRSFRKMTHRRATDTEPMDGILL